MLSGYSRIRAKNRADKNAVYVMWAAFYVNSIQIIVIFPALRVSFFVYHRTNKYQVLPEEFKECIKADPNYAECFE